MFDHPLKLEMPHPLYTPLKTPSSTRLVELLPADEQSSLQMCLIEVDLNDDPEYEALSYTWGDNTEEREVSINDNAVSIRQNLHAALLRLRYKGAARRIWIDAISISQSDMIEKGQQVAQIGDIFGKAARIIAWVGEHSDGSERLFHAWPRERGRDRLSMAEVALRLSIWRPFLERPYFRRLWVVQELVLASSIVVHCGQDSQRWEKLIEARCRLKQTQYGHGHGFMLYAFEGIQSSSQVFADMNPDDEAWEQHNLFFRFPGPLTNLETLIDARKMYQETHPKWQKWQTSTDGIYGRSSVCNLVPKFHRMRCSDWRDRVYALLSLETDRHDRPVIMPNYSINRVDLFIEVCLKRFQYIDKTNTQRTQTPSEGEPQSNPDNYDHHAYKEMRSLSHELLPEGRDCREVLKPLLDRYDSDTTTEEERKIMRLIIILLGRQEILPLSTSAAKLLTPEGRQQCQSWLQQNPDWLRDTPRFKRGHSFESHREVSPLERYRRPPPPRLAPHKQLWNNIKAWVEDTVQNWVPFPHDII